MSRRLPACKLILITLETKHHYVADAVVKIAQLPLLIDCPQQTYFMLQLPLDHSAGAGTIEQELARFNATPQ